MNHFEKKDFIVDDEEKETYQKYLDLPNKLPKLCSLNYHTYQT